MVSAKVPKAICACAIARKGSGLPFTPRRLRGSAEGPSVSLRRTRGIPSAPVPARSSLSSLHWPVSLERPGFAVRGEPALRGGASLDPRLLSGSPIGARLGERRPEKTLTSTPLRLPPRRGRLGGSVLLWNPLTQAERGGRAKGKHEVAGHGPPRSPQAHGCALGEPAEASLGPRGAAGCAAADPGRAFLWVLSCRHKKVPRLQVGEPD